MQRSSRPPPPERDVPEPSTPCRSPPHGHVLLGTGTVTSRRRSVDTPHSGESQPCAFGLRQESGTRRLFSLRARDVPEHSRRPVSLRLMNQHGQRYDRAQQEIVRASVDLEVLRMLDLGVGTGETSRRCLEAHPAARAVCLDESRDKLDAAAKVLGARAELRLGRFQDPLPEGPFELIVSAFALHHVDAAAKADLFPRVAQRLSEGGRFVLADVVEPDAPVSEPTPLDRAQSVVSRADELLNVLRQAGFQPEVRWAEHDMVVIAASVQ